MVVWQNLLACDTGNNLHFHEPSSFFLCCTQLCPLLRRSTQRNTLKQFLAMRLPTPLCHTMKKMSGKTAFPPEGAFSVSPHNS
ncbi:hypothetical protein Pelo_17217 [Pelomyxa schiedti]|nr:hypothetical protein Pelo_17217 [Pelomyxa schiedti]